MSSQVVPPSNVPQHYASLLDNLPDIAWLKDAKGRYLAVNRAFAKLYQRPVEEILGKTDFDFLPRRQATLYARQDAQVMRTRVPSRYEDYMLEDRDGWLETVWLETQLTPVVDEEGTCTGLCGITRDISLHKQDLAACDEQKERLRFYFDQPLIGMALLAPGGFWLDANDRLCQTLGYDRAGLMDTEWKQLVHQDDAAADAAEFERLLLGEVESFQADERFRRADGEVIYGHVLVRIVRKPDGSPNYFLVILEDATERKVAEERLALADNVFEHAAEAIVITDRNNRIMRVNPAFTRLTGYTAEQALGRDPSMLSSGRHDTAFYARMWAILLSSGEWSGEVWDRRRDGSVYPKWMTIKVVFEPGGKEVAYFIAVFSDISERLEAQDIIRHLAYYDALTDLPNRSLFVERLNQAVELAEQQDEGLAVMLFNIDRFKSINDTMGHRIGDDLLKHVGARLRDMQSPGNTVARMGGDEFAILLTDIKKKPPASLMSQLHAQLQQPFHVGGYTFHLVFSAGISLYPADGGNAERLLKNADSAVHYAKQKGGGQFRFFTQQMQRLALEALHVEYELRLAMQRGELELHYQPQVDLRSGEMTGVESLLRWRHPEKGMIPPAKFIPVAEDSGLIIPISEWVLEAACRQAKQWQEQGLPPFTVGVNLSARQFERSDLLGLVESVLASTGLAPERLDLEITEGALMGDVESARYTLTALRAMGVKVSVDDFGTGYSSLAYLKAFPLSKLKIDQSFVRNLENDASNAAIAKAVISLSHSLGLTVVAEGVETLQQKEYLSACGCNIAQGYFYSRPLEAHAIGEFLADTSRLALEPPERPASVRVPLLRTRLM
ncbi:sensor domain-containing protein [Methylogaea oryzae]|uniref:cyclic-guanylate-specific phosphodiesterase n=1 Tax=Methylogaea oryzae TaxID=1295382 RepID=A0A8D4VR00_9GAMM|nr:EAL domain-containing protein [Methylogaea oryzae]BBL72112.1 hypothetical protein MoryE10_27180 [Methylogaea oryzae]